MTRAVSGELTVDDGVAIAHHRWGEPGDAPPVVLLHGFLSHAKLNWQTTGVSRALVTAGRWVVGVDARGHGRSDKPHDVAAYGRERMAEDVRAVVADLGVPGFDLAGYSMGALTAATVAVDDDRVGRLVLAGIGAAAVEHGTWDISSVPPDELVAALRADDPDAIGHAGAASFRAFADRAGADRLAMAAVAEARGSERIPFERIPAETLVLAGRDDPLAERPEVVADAIRDARLELIDGDHLGATRNDRFATVIAEFLAR